MDRPNTTREQEQLKRDLDQAIVDAHPSGEPKLNFPFGEDWRFDQWIEFQAQLQRVGGKGDPLDIDDPEVMRDFATWNGFAACAEIHEMVDNMGWKPWDDNRGLIDADQRERAIREGVDALHFLGNLFRALNATGEEISQYYREKAQKNLDRWREGYDARATKCPGCGRDFGESDCVPGEFCMDIGHEVQEEDQLPKQRDMRNRLYEG